MDGILFALTLAGALGCGLNGGVFFAFSTFVMQGLGRLPAAQGLAAMQAINVTAVTFAFMLALFGTAVVVGVLGVWAVTTWSEPYAPWMLAGAVLYLAGTIGMTIAFHVPRNDALAKVAPDAADAAARWGRYLSEWTAGNHVRTVAGLLAAAALTVALQVG
jgi:uncharacterized membrane protein